MKKQYNKSPARKVYIVSRHTCATTANSTSSSIVSQLPIASSKPAPHLLCSPPVLESSSPWWKGKLTLSHVSLVRKEFLGG